MRRAFDIAGALVLLLLTLPLLIVAAAVVLVTSGRPVFFGHVRVGRGGRLFRCWKLRTMAIDAERVLDRVPDLRARYVANGYKLPMTQDPRVTLPGRWLRRSYIDELPQFFNVLNGTMSLVGPRPVVPDELTNYGTAAAELLTARPGIFGAWALGGRARAPYPERVNVELEYVRSRTLAADVAILVRSIPVVLSGQAPDA
jgi:exopolysaccharide production protein ExoY